MKHFLTGPEANLRVRLARIKTGVLAWVCCGTLMSLASSPAAEPEHCFGALQSTLEHAEEGRHEGWNVAEISVAWDVFAPKQGEINEAYVKKIQEKIRSFRALGYRLQLDFGMQYPPSWIFQLPQPRYRNQYGRDYETGEPGKRMPNMVFNQALRVCLAQYMEQVFQRLGTDWDYIRLGGGLYGEVNYPRHRFDGKENCYWAFDELAQGKVKGLAEGVKPCPVPGWLPGMVSPDHDASRKFLSWYLESLQNYHDWQITTARRWYTGEICMMYGSWGVRPGQIERAIENNLDGSSPSERVGEIQTGYDWARMVSGIRDPKVIVYCTWIDAPRKDCDDTSQDPTRWSPVHWLAFLASANPLKLKVWGENTGHNDREEMLLTFERSKQFGLMGVMWAFEKELFANPNPDSLATFRDFAECIGRTR